MRCTDKIFCGFLRLEIRTLKKALAAKTLKEIWALIADLWAAMFNPDCPYEPPSAKTFGEILPLLENHPSASLRHACPSEPFLYFLKQQRILLADARRQETLAETKARIAELLEELQRMLDG